MKGEASGIQGSGRSLCTRSLLPIRTPLTDYIRNTKHRMPAILSAGDEGRWLDLGLGKKDIAGVLGPFPVGGDGGLWGS